jgi:hypothetical protein
MVHKSWNTVFGHEPRHTPAANTDEDSDPPQTSTTLRKKITKREKRHAGAFSAIFTCLDKVTFTKVFQLNSDSAIWARLTDEFGQVSDVKRADHIS